MLVLTLNPIISDIIWQMMAHLTSIFMAEGAWLAHYLRLVHQSHRANFWEGA